MNNLSKFVERTLQLQAKADIGFEAYWELQMQRE